MTELAIPAGFEPMPMGGPFIAGNGPFFVHKENGVIRLGLPIEARHCNSIGTVHGGMIASFADMLMPTVFYHHPEVAARRRAVPTVSIQLDYMGAAALGDWLEGEAQVLNVKRSMVFAQGLIHANGKTVARCSGVYKFGPEFSGLNGMFGEGMDAALPRQG